MSLLSGCGRGEKPWFRKLSHYAAVLVFSCFVFPANASADFSGYDSLAVASANWQLHTVEGAGQLVFRNNRLEFLVQTPAVQNRGVAIWNPNTGSFRNGWFIQTDVHLDKPVVPENSFLDLGIQVESSAAASGRCYQSLCSLRDVAGDFRGILMSNENGVIDSIGSSLTDATLRIHFDPVGQNLIGSVYDGKVWLYSSPVSVASWGMGPSDVFYAAIGARNGGQDAAGLVNTSGVYFRNFRAGPASPEISVEQPLGTALADRKNTTRFGNVRMGKSKSRSYIIRNTGTKALQNLDVVIDGVNRKDFRIEGGLATNVLMPGGAIKLKIAFRPKSKGTRKANLHIISDDKNEASFDVGLTGQGLK